MEPGTCNVLYIDRDVKEDRRLTSFEPDTTAEDVEREPAHVMENAKHLLKVFGEG